MERQRIHPVLQCLAAVGSVCVAGLVRLAIDPLLAGRPAYLIFMIPAIVIARHVSTWAAVCAFVLGSVVCTHVFVDSPQERASSTAGLPQATIYVLSGACLIALMASSRRQAERLLQKTSALEEEIANTRMLEAELSLGQEEFRALAGHYPVGVFRADASGDVVYMNDFWCDMTGLTREQALAAGWARAIHPDDADAVVSQWQAAVRAGRTYMGECRLVDCNAAIRNVICIGEPVRRSDGVLAHYFGLVFDVTDLRQAQERLRQRESQLTSLADHLPAVVFMKDREGRYTQVNRHWSELFGDGSLLVGKTDYEYFPKEVADKLVEADAKVWESAGPVTIEESAPLADGVHTYLSVKFPITDDQGRMIAVGGVSTDVTELKATRESLEQKQNLLRRLIEVQEHEKSLLCHEFHDGLIQYAVASQMILQGCLDGGPRVLPVGVARSIGEAARMLSVGIEDGRRVIRGIRTAVLDDIGLEAAIDDLVEHVMSPSIEVHVDLDPGLDDLPPQLQTTAYRIVQEAFSNARRHSGSPRVLLTARRCDGEVRLTIQDFGCGFDPAAARHHGLGLPGMQERAAIAGGEVTVASRPEGGTTIIARLPDHVADSVESAFMAATQAHGAVP